MTMAGHAWSTAVTEQSSAPTLTKTPAPSDSGGTAATFRQAADRPLPPPMSAVIFGSVPAGKATARQLICTQRQSVKPALEHGRVCHLSDKPALSMRLQAQMAGSSKPAAQMTRTEQPPS